MTLSAPIRLNRGGGLGPGKTRHRQPAGPTRPKGAVSPYPSTKAVTARVVLMVDFISPEERTWRAIGGGDTLAEALAFAQDSCPADTTWRPAGWSDLYGD